MEGVDDEVVRNVIRSLVVIVWSIVTPRGEGAPDISFIIDKRGKQYFGTNKDQLTDEEAQFGLLLDKYGFSHCDEFDMIMIDDIRNGFFNDEKIASSIEKYLNDANRNRALAALRAAWEPFHNSFDDNAEDVANSIFSGCVGSISYLTPSNLDSAVAVLKAIGYPDKGRALLDKYMTDRGSENIFDRSGFFGPNITDPDVIMAFDQKASYAIKPLPTPLEAASRIYTGGWSEADEEALDALSSDSYVDLFKNTKGDDRSVLIYGCLEFRKFTNATQRQKRIAEKAQAALERISDESPLNAQRMAAFNIRARTPNMPEAVSEAKEETASHSSEG